MKLSIIIPTYNLKQRGWGRVTNMVFSLFLQDLDPDQFEVIISDGSTDTQFNYLRTLLLTEPPQLPKNFRIIHTKDMDVFNKPVLVNSAIKQAQGEYMVCTDADYLYSADMLSIISERANPEKFLIHRVQMLPQITIDYNRIGLFAFPKCPDNPYGDLANGGCQVFHRDWFERSGGYDERMNGWCGMDNDMVIRAGNAGLEVVWIGEGTILHQFHPIEKGKRKLDKERMLRNWKIRDNDTSIKRNTK